MHHVIHFTRSIKREQNPYLTEPEIEIAPDIPFYNDDINDSYDVPEIVTDEKVQAPKPTFEPPKKKTKRTVTEHPSLRLKQIVNQVPLPHTGAFSQDFF